VGVGTPNQSSSPLATDDTAESFLTQLSSTTKYGFSLKLDSACDLTYLSRLAEWPLPWLVKAKLLSDHRYTSGCPLTLYSMLSGTAWKNALKSLSHRYW